jgi:glycosyltransferase involved in cell wall biosynthesis
VRLRRQIARRHRADPYDVVYQFSSIESLAVPARVTRRVPLVIHPETHGAGELRSLIADRRQAIRCQSLHRFLTVASIMLARSIVQRSRIRSARLVVCISRVFRDHLIRDYNVSPEDTVVVPNPVRIDRFSTAGRVPGEPATVLVLGRIAVRKGIDDVVAVAKALLAREEAVRIRVVGGPSLWSDYTPLLEELPSQNSEYAGPVAASEIPGELARSDLLLQASTYEPFALTVAEALASGAPVVATSEVGAIEDVDRSVAVEVPLRDVEAMVDAIGEMLQRVRSDPAGISARARSEAERLFEPAVVCRQISAALERLVEREGGESS